MLVHKCTNGTHCANMLSLLCGVCVCALVCVCMCCSYVCVYIDMYVCHCCMCVETFAKTSKEKCLCNEQLRTREPSMGSNTTFNCLDSQTNTTIEAYERSKVVRRKKSYNALTIQIHL